jgi:serine/threonine protein kinase
MTASAARRASTDPQRAGAAGSTGIVLHDTYTLGPLIGQGGMGEVYEAAHVRLPGRFAVKILRPDLLTNQAAVARFCREAEIMSELRHPHIIQIFDFNTSTEGLPYFVMEYLDGVDLETRLIKTGALPLVAVVRIVDAVASALGAAHAMGVVHRDLKPANIFLIRGEGQDDDFVKVIDFGISKTASPGPRLSQASEVIGTPAFMGPEQALGLVAQIDPRTDQFALAAITYLMLTGREPFVGNDAVSLLYQVVHEQPLPVSRFVAWDTTEIQLVLDRALAKRQEDRFDTIVAFAQALGTAAESLMGQATPPAVVPPRQAAVSPPSARIRAVRMVPSEPSPVSLDEDDAPPPVKRPTARPLDDLDLPRRLDRIPHGPQRAVVLGLAVLGLASVIVHKGWYRGFPQRAANLEQGLVSLVHRGWQAPPPVLPKSAAAPTPIVVAPRDLPPPSEALPALEDQPPSKEPVSDTVAASDETPAPVEEAPALADEAPQPVERAPVRPTHHRRSGSSRLGWQDVIELPYRAAPAPSEPAVSPMRETPAPSLAPAPLMAPDGFSIPQPSPSIPQPSPS